MDEDPPTLSDYQLIEATDAEHILSEQWTSRTVDPPFTEAEKLLAEEVYYDAFMEGVALGRQQGLHEAELAKQASASVRTDSEPK